MVATATDYKRSAGRGKHGEEGEAFSLAWRREQLEYSWKRSLMGKWVPFWQITRDSLDATLAVYGRAGDDALRQRLIGAYKKVSPYPNSGPALDALAQAGIRCVILTNGSRDMVSSALAAAGFEDKFERMFSVDDVQVFKPDPRVYQLARDGLDLEPAEILMVSSHPWDLAGAIAYGFQGVWIDRPGAGHHIEKLGFDPDHHVADISELATLLAG